VLSVECRVGEKHEEKTHGSYALRHALRA
jgi:hypothetical protein